MKRKSLGKEKNKNFVRKQGVVLISVMILLFFASFIVGSILSYSEHSSMMIKRSIDLQRSYITAEAALEYGTMILSNMLRKDAMRGNITQSDIDNIFSDIPDPPDDNYVYRVPDLDADYEEGDEIPLKDEIAFKVEMIDPRPINGAVPSGPSAGRDGKYQRFRIVCGAVNPKTGVGTVLSQEIQAISTYLVRFGVFYENDLDIHPGATMVFKGPVHSNGNIFIGGSLSFESQITARGGIFNYRQETGARNGTGVTIMDDKGTKKNTYGSYTYYDQWGNKKTENRYFDSDLPTWKNDAINRWGGMVKTSAHGVQRLAPPIDGGDDPHDLIERPKQYGIDTNVNADTEEQKFANKAALYIHIDENGNLTAKDENGDIIQQPTVHSDGSITDEGIFKRGKIIVNANDGNANKDSGTGRYYFEYKKEGVFETGNTFTDLRERYDTKSQEETMAPVDIYVDELLKAYPNFLSANDDQKAGVVYITAERPRKTTITTSTVTERVQTGTVVERVWDKKKRKWVDQVTPQYETITKEICSTNTVVGGQPCVRLRNASDLSKAEDSGISFISDLPVYVDGNFNTSGTYNGGTSVAALVAGDAVTMLSNNWQDRHSHKTGMYERTPSPTKFNGVVMTGNTTTTWDNYNGGLENVFRFLENWDNISYTFAGSIICMWTSQIADSNWVRSGSAIPGVGGNSTVYKAPKRYWGYDELYTRKSPPGLPPLITIEEAQWRRCSWSEEF